MSSTVISPAALWTGRILSGLVVAFVLLDRAIKLVPIEPVTATLQQLEFAVTDGLARGIGIITLSCAVLYAIPRTSLLGATLLTGLLGGAMAVHPRAESPLFTHLLFGFYVGVIAWGGLWLRDPALRALLPFRGSRTT